MAIPAHQPNPESIFNALTAYQQTMALTGAIDLEIFTHIADGALTVKDIAQRSKASERGVRILCDYLTIHGFLSKTGDRYDLSADSAVFLNKRSPAYLGAIANFLVNDRGLSQFRHVADIVRHGGTLDPGNMAPDDPVWVEFARSMVPIVIMPARSIAPVVSEPGRKMKVLDIAAGHGMFGISVALHNPAAEIVAVDWKNVLEVALENATKAGVAGRYRTIAGSAFDVDLGTGYDVVLIPNFLHHFDPPTNVKLLKKVRAALKPGGLAATLEFVPNVDRVTPPTAAAFSLMMLGSTPHGDAYTFIELDRMFREAGFGESAMRDLPPSPERLILTKS